MPTATTQISGGTAHVAYDLSGSGPGVVLVHGTAAARDQWLQLTEAINDRYTVVAPDYSGSGGTVDHGGPLTLADLAAEIRVAADHAGLTTFHVVGHSLGAVIGAHLAATHPERVRSLVMHAGFVHTDSRMDAEFRYWLELLHTDVRLFARMLPLAAFGPRYWAGNPDNELLVKELAGVIAPGADRQTEVDRAVDLRPLLGRITAPTLVLASTHDRVVGADQQQALLAGISNARYAEIDAGHGAPAEDPAGFAARITAFLDEQEGQFND
jgi:pimeloyl-ACP methyl ester carboxylesterase